MIWFACKQCGKVHGRGENSVGSMVFCPCGQGNVVPWESSAAAPPPEAASPPPLNPVRFDAPPLPPPPTPRVRRRRRPFRPEQRNPNFCFNHAEKDKEAACADCGESFCNNCLVTFQSTRLCGPCKNHRVRMKTRRSRAPALAVLSVVFALFAGPWLLPRAATGLLLAAMIVEGLALTMALIALRQTANNRVSAGQSLAWTGVFAAVILAMFNLLVAWHAPRFL